MTKNLYTDDEHDAIARYVLANRQTIQDRAGPHRWRRSPQFIALVNDLARHSEGSIALKTIAFMDWAGIGQGGREWTHDDVRWMRAASDRIAADPQPETAADAARRLGFGDLLE
jgi:hypothetical protein